MPARKEAEPWSGNGNAAAFCHAAALAAIFIRIGAGAGKRSGETGSEGFDRFDEAKSGCRQTRSA